MKGKEEGGREITAEYSCVHMTLPVYIIVLTLASNDPINENQLQRSSESTRHNHAHYTASQVKGRKKHAHMKTKNENKQMKIYKPTFAAVPREEKEKEKG